MLTIEAATNSVAYVISLETLHAFWETDIQTLRLRSIVAEKLYAQFYERVISLHCDTAEERYLKLIQQYPEVTNKLSLKDIASYLSVTPETVSHIRKNNDLTNFLRYFKDFVFIIYYFAPLIKK